MTCGGCKYFAQGKENSFCEHPKQFDKDKKSYCYYSYSCPLFTEGIADSRLNFMGITRKEWDERDVEQIKKDHEEKIKKFYALMNQL